MSKWMNKYFKKHETKLNQRLVGVLKLKGRDQNFETIKNIMIEFGFQQEEY